MLLAVMFLTRVPVPAGACRGNLGRAVAWFPIVGAGLGSCGAVFAYAAMGAGVPPALTALLLVSLGAWVTGAVHLDGLADTADGLGGGRSRDAVLRIMRDPRLGSFGALALMLVVSIKAAALAVLLERGIYAALLVTAPALARATVAPLGGWLPYARPEGGLGKAITRHMTKATIAMTTATAAVIAIAALGAAAAGVLAAAAVVTLGIGASARRRIGGVTGDVFGACIELTEAAVLATGVLVT